MREHEPRSRCFSEKWQDSLSTLKEFFLKPNPNLAQPGEISLTEYEQNLPNTLNWNLNPEYVAGAGIIQSGSIYDFAREVAFTAKIKEGLEQGGCTVHLMPIDILLEILPVVSIPYKIEGLGKDPHVGVRDQAGKPRAVIITGFSQSKFLTERGLRWLMEASEGKDFGNVKKRADSEVFPNESLSESLEEISNQEERERIAAYVFAHNFFDNWQCLATRKNTQKENIITMIVMPKEALEAFLAYETGTRRPIGAQSDFLFRMREFVSNV